MAWPRLLAVSMFVVSLLPAAASAQVVIAPGAGSDPVIRVMNPDGTEASFLAYAQAFQGGVRVALGDVNGDGVVDIITGAGPTGGPHVKVFSGADLSLLASFFAYDPFFTGGVYVAAGDVNGDGRADIITGAGAGDGPLVNVFSGADLSVLASFNAYTPAHQGGVFVAAGDVNGDGRADIITGAGPGGGPHVRVFSGVDLSDLASFFAYDTGFTGGVSVASLDADGDGLADIVTGAGPGGGPHVRVFSGADLSNVWSFFPYDPLFSGGVSVAAADFDGDGQPDIVTGPGPGGGPHVRVFRASDLADLASFYAFDPFFAGGIFIGSLPGGGGLHFTSPATTTFTAGSAGTFTVTTVGNPVPAITQSGTLPAGVIFTDNGDGTATLAGTPGAGTGGSSVLTFTADNGSGTPATQSFTLNVREAPAITSAAATTFTIGAAGTFTVTTTGFPRPTITRTGAAPPSDVQWVDSGNGTGTLSGTPAAGTGGTYAITFTADNGISPAATQSFTLTVSGAPAFTSATTTTFTVGSPGTFTVSAIGTPTPTLAVSGTLPAGVTFVANPDGTGTLSGTPAAGTGGTHAVTFTASNGVLPNATQTFTLNVNQAPAITSAASATFTIGAAGSFTVTTSGFPAPSLTRGGVALPSGLQFVDNGNGTGTLSGTPAAGTGGTYAISFTATNVVGSTAPQPFTLTVSQPPAITSAASTAFTVGVAGSFTVTTTGFPTPGITRTGVALPGGVTFTDNGDGTGTLSGTPAAGTAGSYAITFTAANGALPNAVQAFTLTVQQAPAITSAASTTFTVGTPGTFTVTTTGFPTPTVSQTGALPSGVTFTTATRVLAGPATQTGAFPLVFTATNGVPPDATQNFTLNVVCPAITVTPLVMPDGLYQTVYAGVDFNQTGSTGTTFTWGATGLPAGLTIDVNTGVVSGTATNTVLAGGVTVTVTDNFGCQGSRTTALTVRPTTDNENYAGGVGNTQYVTGAPFPLTPHVAFVDDVKTGDAGPGALSVTFPATSTNGGTIVEGTGDGTFTYTPTVAFAGPTDTFTYTLTDGNGVTNTGLVTINLSNVVWYVNSAGGAGDGRSHNPFNTLSVAATPSGSTHIIYVHSGGATTTGNLAMDANQTLHGQGATFTLNGLTIAAGTRPTLTGTVTLADNTTVRAVNFTPSGIAAMAASGVSFAQPVTIDQVNVTGGTSALSLTNVTATATGAINVSNANFTNTSAAEVLISQGNIPVTLAATATISSNAGRSIDIQNRTGGIVSFTGAISDTGQGIFLNSNTGSTINFAGALTLNTGANPALTATGGGTVSNSNAVVNTITTTTGTALNVANTTIGSSGLTFRSIAVNGAANAIVLNNTGTTAGLTVTGDGNTTQGGNASGGLIQNTTGVGISLTNAANVSLNNMHLNFTGSHGVNGTGVLNFSFTNGKINEAGTTGVSDESCVSFDDLNASNLRGTFTFTNSQCTLTEANGIDIENWGATLSDVTISGNLFTDKGDVATPGSAVLLIGNSSASASGVVTKATLTNNTITDFRAGAGFVLQANADAAGAHPVTYGTAGSATNVITVTGNLMDGGNGGIGNQPDRFVTGGINRSGQGNYNVSNNGTAANRIRHIDCIGIELQADGPVTVTTTVQDNFINANSAVGCAGIAIGTDDPANIGVAGTHATVISGNNVMGTDGPGIYAIVRNSISSMTARILNNTVAAPITTNAARAGIRVDSGSAQGNTTLCVQISGNTTAGSTNTATATTSPGINLRKQSGVATTNVFGIVGLSPSPTGTPTVENYVNGLNTSTSGTFGVNGTALLSATSGFVSCTIP
jgi:large repetitive protein